MDKALDVVVVGGGPAGLMAAKAAAERGLAVGLIEKRHDVSEVRRACCAQFIMDDGYEGEALEVRDSRIVFPRNGFEVGYTGPTLGVIDKYYHSPRGHRIHFAHPDRRPFAIKFDKGTLLRGLWDECERLGVALMPGTVAFDAKDRGDRVELEAVRKGQRLTVEARKAILAEGVNAHLTGALGMNAGRPVFAVAHVLKIAVEGVTGFEPQSWNLFYGQVYRSFAAVIVGPSLKDGVVEMTLMGNQKMPPEAIFAGFTQEGPLRERYRKARVLDRHGGALRAAPAQKTPFKGNALAIGDAAAYVEVEVQGALLCGFHAARAVADELTGAPGFERYAAWWREAFEFNRAEALKVAQGYALVPTYTDDELDTLFALVEGERLEGTYSQYKTPALIWQAILRHKETIAREHPALHEKVKRIDQMTLKGTF